MKIPSKTIQPWHDPSKDIERDINALGEEERRALIRLLVAELDTPADSDVERAWLEESQRRYVEVTEGGVVERAVSLLLENPHLGAPVQREIRHLVLRTFPHSLIYTASHERILILAVAHGRRQPGYWRSRST